MLSPTIAQAKANSRKNLLKSKTLDKDFWAHDSSQEGAALKNDVKQSKDRINALKSIFPFYSNNKTENNTTSDDEIVSDPSIKSGYLHYRQKTTCKSEGNREKKLKKNQECILHDDSRTDSVCDEKNESIVHSRIASYEKPYKKKNAEVSTKDSISPRLKEKNQSCFKEGTSKAKKLSERSRQMELKEEQYVVEGICTYEEIPYKRLGTSRKTSKNEALKKTSTSGKEIGSEDYVGSFENSADNNEDNLLDRLKSKIDKIEAGTNIDNDSNVIVGNKDILKLLSSKHLSNLNIRVDKNCDIRNNRVNEKSRDNLGSFRTSKYGVRSSLRNSRRKRRQRHNQSAKATDHSPDDNGVYGAIVKTKKTEIDPEKANKVRLGNSQDYESKNTSEFKKNKFPEYAKVNKKKGVITIANSEDAPRSSSTSPIEKAPVVKKICSGNRCKKDLETHVSTESLSKTDASKGNAKVRRKSSISYNCGRTATKTNKETLENDSFVKSQAVRLRRKNSKNCRKNEYRVSVTIRPSTVADLANKFNSLVHQNDLDKSNKETVEPNLPKYYSSPRASFKRKYRHKASKASREHGTYRTIKDSSESRKVTNEKSSKCNSPCELKVEDFLENYDYNKTDEEKVCEKIKTALGSGKFKGETDDSEDDLSSKGAKESDEIDEATKNSEFEKNQSLELSENVDSMSKIYDKCSKLEYERINIAETSVKYETDSEKSKFHGNSDCEMMNQNEKTFHSKSDSIDSGISADDSEKIHKSQSAKDIEKVETNLKHIMNTDSFKRTLSSSLQLRERSESSDIIMKKDDLYEDREIISEHDESDPSSTQNMNLNTEEVNLNEFEPNKSFLSTLLSNKPYSMTDDYASLETSKSIDSGISSLQLTSSKDEILKLEEKDVDNKSVNDPDEFEDTLKGILKDTIFESQSEYNSAHEDSYSEVSSLCSEFKEKKDQDDTVNSRDGTKNTVKKTKERDAERKDCEKDVKRRRSPSRERKKWFKRGKSKERNDKNVTGTLKKEKKVKIYEKWTFKRFRDKSGDRDKTKQPMKDKKNITSDASEKEDNVHSKENSSEYYEDVKSDKDSSNYGKFLFGSRSRNRDKKNKTTSGDSSGKVSTSDIIALNEIDLCLSKDSPDLNLTCERMNVSIEPLKTYPEDVVDDQIYEPHTPTQKAFPPISPEKQGGAPQGALQKLLSLNKTKTVISKEPISQEEKDDGCENIYENLYSPDLKKLQRNRIKLEEEGIKPNSSFLWSETATIVAAKTSIENEKPDVAIEKCPKKSKKSSKQEPKDRYDKIGVPSDEATYDGPNYTEIQNNISEDSQNAAYDDIGTMSAVSYDEIRAPSSCGYDDIRPPSSNGYDQLKPPSEAYDPVNPPKSDSSQYDDCDGGIVTAQLAVVREDQVDSISYLYDDISNYNVSLLSHSYEPVCPPSAQSTLHFSAIKEETRKVSNEEIECDRKEDGPTEISEEYLDPSDESDCGVHEVFSYKLTKIGVLPARSAIINASENDESLHKIKKNTESVLETSNHTAKKHIYNRIPKTRARDRSDWVDVSDAEADVSPNITLTTQIPLFRFQNRPKRVARYRVTRRPWTQGVREVAIQHKYHLKQQEKKLQQLQRFKDQQLKSQSISSKSHSLLKSKTENVIAYSWRQKRPDSDDNEENPADHYEAIYEVISPASDDVTTPKDDLVPGDDLQEPKRPDDSPLQNDDLDDSFDSDDSDEAYSRLVSQEYSDAPFPNARRLGESFSSDLSNDSAMTRRHHYSRSQSHQPPINKIAEAANIGMKRLRRNWSFTKNEVRTGIDKMKKKSTFSMTDMKSTENILQELTKASSEKAKWSFKSHFRRKSISTSTLPLSLSPTSDESTDKEKERATFYLTLTIASDREQEGEEDQEVPADTSRPRPKSFSTFNPPTISSPISSSTSTQSSLSLRQLESKRPQSAILKSEELSLLPKERRKSLTPSLNSVSSSLSDVISTSSNAFSLKNAGVLRNASSGSNCSIPFRPKTAPPAPPFDKSNDDYEEATVSKDEFVNRLNQIFAAGPTTPHGRRILKSSDSSCSDSSLNPSLVLDDSGHQGLFTPGSSVSRNGSSNRGASNTMSNLRFSVVSPTRTPSACSASSGSLPTSPTAVVSPDGGRLPSEVTSSVLHNTPQARLSVVSASSHSSSEGYMKTSEIASAPPPLPARPAMISRRMSTPNFPSSLSLTATDTDSRTYLELNCDSTEEPPYMSSHFADEPLYQFYTAKVERAALYQGDCSSEDDYEVINDVREDALNLELKLPCRPTAMELVTPTDGRRTLWCELPEVVNSGVLAELSSQQRKIKEANFEVVTSEASYLKSLEVLVKHFMLCDDFSRAEDPVVTKMDKKVLFSDIIAVKKCSETFLADLEKRWQESFNISSITDIVLKHANSSFNVYVKYCSNQIYQDRMLRRLKAHNIRFVDVLTRLEMDSICQSLAMHSFLMLPMQRITRLPLLIDAIFNRLEYGSSQWQECKLALTALTKIVAECNEGARKMERMEEMLILSSQLDFRDSKAIPLISASRWLVKKGEITRLTWRESDAKLTFGRKISKHSLYFFLFTDLLVVTKKKNDDQYMVLDYCPRNMVQMLELESADKFPGRLLDGHKNLLILTMLQNHENRTVEMVLSFILESDRTRWMEAVTPRTSDNPDERIYEEWDCPQVQVIHPYTATQPDELTLDISGVINVLKKTSDGWYQGERLRDGERGWFPGNHSVEVASAHVRARNLRQRYRLLAISGSIIDELKKEKERYEKEEKKKDRRKTITIKDTL